MTDSSEKVAISSNELLNRAKAIVNHGGEIVYPSRAAAQRVRDIIADLVKEIEENNEVTARCYMRLQCADVPREPWHWEVCTTLDSTGIPSTHASYDLVTRLQTELAEANKIIAHQSLSIWKQPTAHETCEQQPVAWRRYVDDPYEIRPRWLLTSVRPLVDASKWEPLYAPPTQKADPQHGAKARDFVEYDSEGGVRIDLARYLRTPAGQAQLRSLGLPNDGSESEPV